MRRIQGIKNLMVYLESVHYPLTEEEICELIAKRTLPHLKRIGNMVIFDLDHIDWWINTNRTKN